MRVTSALAGNLNKIHWNRRVWEVGYRGNLLPQQKATGRPDYPVTPYRTALLRERFQREYNVMTLLARPYVTKEAETAYLTKVGVESWKEIIEKEKADMEARRMPGKPKRTEGTKTTLHRYADIGNLLHTHSTVEDSLKDIIQLRRWD